MLVQPSSYRWNNPFQWNCEAGGIWNIWFTFWNETSPKAVSSVLLGVHGGTCLSCAVARSCHSSFCRTAVACEATPFLRPEIHSIILFLICFQCAYNPVKTFFFLVYSCTSISYLFGWWVFLSCNLETPLSNIEALEVIGCLCEYFKFVQKNLWRDQVKTCASAAVWVWAH